LESDPGVDFSTIRWHIRDSAVRESSLSMQKSQKGCKMGEGDGGSEDASLDIVMHMD